MGHITDTKYKVDYVKPNFFYNQSFNKITTVIIFKESYSS